MQSKPIFTKRNITLGLTGLGVLLYIHLTIGSVIAAGLLVIWYSSLGLAALAALTGAALGIRKAVAAWQITTAEVEAARGRAKIEARHIVSFGRDQQVFEFSGDNTPVRALHLTPRARFNGPTVIEPTQQELVTFQIFHRATRASGNAAPALLPSPPTAPLLPALSGCDNILVVGGKGTGKTTLLQHIEAQRIQSGQCVVLDSHAQPAQWQGHVIGLGRQYQNIKNGMIALTDKLNRRYQRYATGYNGFNPINTFIDEFTLLPQALKGAGYNVQSYSVPVLTEGRKVRINALWGIHSDRAEALGLKGAYDLLECFDALVYLKNVKGEIYAIVDFGEGKETTRYTHPGPFETRSTPALQPSQQPTTPQLTPPSQPELQPTEREQTILAAWEQHRSFPKIHHYLTGASKPGGKNYKLYQQVLDKFGIKWTP